MYRLNDYYSIDTEKNILMVTRGDLTLLYSYSTHKPEKGDKLHVSDSFGITPYVCYDIAKRVETPIVSVYLARYTEIHGENILERYHVELKGGELQ